VLCVDRPGADRFSESELQAIGVVARVLMAGTTGADGARPVARPPSRLALNPATPTASTAPTPSTAARSRRRPPPRLDPARPAAARRLSGAAADVRARLAARLESFLQGEESRGVVRSASRSL